MRSAGVRAPYLRCGVIRIVLTGRLNMLVLSRKSGQQIVINGNTVISVVSVRGKTVRLGIKAPGEIPIFRGELLHREPDFGDVTRSLGRILLLATPSSRPRDGGVAGRDSAASAAAARGTERRAGNGTGCANRTSSQRWEEVEICGPCGRRPVHLSSPSLRADVRSARP